LLISHVEGLSKFVATFFMLEVDMSNQNARITYKSQDASVCDPDVRCAISMTPWRAAVLCGCSILMGLFIALTASLFVIFPLLGTGSLDQDRKLALGESLSNGLLERTNGRPTAVFLGDSVSVDGIDALLVETYADSHWRVLNLAIPGCNRTGLHVILPAVLAGKPDVLVMVLQPDMCIAQFELPEDSAVAYALGRFPTYWPSDWFNPAPRGIPPDSLRALSVGELEGRLHFRNSPQIWINSTLRERLRVGARVPAPDDWTTPFVRTTSLTGPTLDLNIYRVRRDTVERQQATNAADRDDLTRLLRACTESGVKLLIVGSPVHPRLRPTVQADRDVLRELVGAESARGEGSVVYVDAFELLDESSFADAVHPNGPGREALSAFIGKALKSAWNLKGSG
jgi:hypothetical protein